MAASNLYQYYGSDSSKINPTQSVDDRFALPGFADAAAKAGYTKDTYAIDMNNEGANSKILANLPLSQLITTSKPATTQGAKDGADLASLLASLGTTNSNQTNSSGDAADAPYSDAFTKALDDASSTSSAATKSLMSGINATYQNNVNEAISQGDSYKRGLQLLGIQHNESTFSPDLLAAHITSAGNDVAKKIQGYQIDKSKALMDAETAQQNGDLSTLKDKMNYVRQVQQDQQSAITDAYTNLSKTNDAAGVEAHTIYDSLQTLDPADQEQFIQAVAQKYNIPVMSLVTALGDEKNTRDSAALKTQDTESIIANRKAGGGSSATATSKAQIVQGQNTLNSGISPNGTKLGNPKGADGFYDPYVYIKTFSEWPGSAKSFIAAYPMVGGINPASYTLLPAALQALLPKTSSSSSGRSTTG